MTIRKMSASVTTSDGWEQYTNGRIRILNNVHQFFIRRRLGVNSEHHHTLYRGICFRFSDEFLINSIHLYTQISRKEQRKLYTHYNNARNDSLSLLHFCPHSGKYRYARQIAS